jgi:predicted RNA-binding protein associated with RNAse of E/G family
VWWAGLRVGPPHLHRDTIYFVVDIARLAFAVSVGLACVVVIVSAFVLAGAVLALIRADHRNPVARIGLDWYDRRWHEPPTRHA